MNQQSLNFTTLASFVCFFFLAWHIAYHLIEKVEGTFHEMSFPFVRLSVWMMKMMMTMEEKGRKQQFHLIFPFAGRRYCYCPVSIQINIVLFAC